MHSPELHEARRLFERAEQDSDPEDKFVALEEALDITDDFMAEHDTSGSEVAYATNLRHSYLRRLVGQLDELHKIEIVVWFNYIKLLLVRVGPEIEEIIKDNPVLRESHEQFLKVWMDILMEAIEIHRARSSTSSE
ncbi:MAG: hypothetical protein ACREPU_07455 [Rhodanobacteraceae bacterium]